MRLPSFNRLHCCQKSVRLLEVPVGVGMPEISGFPLPLGRFTACIRRITAQRGFTLIESLVATGDFGLHWCSLHDSPLHQHQRNGQDR